MSVQFGYLDQVCYPREEFFTMMKGLIKFSDAVAGMWIATAVGIFIGFCIGVWYMRRKHGLEE